MKRTTFARFDRGIRSTVWGGAVLGLLLAAGSSLIGEPEPEYRNRDRNAGFALFAGPTAVLEGNQLQCGIDNEGQVCTDVFNSPTGGGGLWPPGSPNQYIFNTGLQVAGIMGADGGPWANDTVGGFFFDASGGQQQGSALSSIYNSADPDDLAAWPRGDGPTDGFGKAIDARVLDEAVYNSALIGRDFASQQDTWVKYWEGNPINLQFREHPMGIAVTQRSLAWNFPQGNESVIYFVYTFENATDEPLFRQQNNIAFFGGDDVLPAAGITLNEVYVAMGTDMDVGTFATDNFSTAILPFDLGLSYRGNFDAPEFIYPPELFFPPFFTSGVPGLIGVKYLKSPINPDTGEEQGLTLFSTTIRQVPGAVPDPTGPKQLWRYLSGKVDPALGDVPCNVLAETPTSRSLCFVYQQSADTRFFQASGPFTLIASGEGSEATVVVAYVNAPTVETMPDGSPSGIVARAADANSNPPGNPSFHPGFDSARGCDVNGLNCTEFIPAAGNPIKAIERAAGWYTYSGPAPDEPVESQDHKLPVQNPDGSLNVEVVPGSLLGRSLVAQAIFDAQFLLGFAPEQPVFYLVPGDGNVTVLWEPSVTEEDGDPFFDVAGNPESPLFNPNYRQLDVEGYRVWRGNTRGDLQLIAQFDFDGDVPPKNTFFDYLCETVRPDEDIGNPDVGYAAGEDCPASFEDDLFFFRLINNSTRFNNAEAGAAPGSGTARLADGSAAELASIEPCIDDLPGDSCRDTGIPYVYQDFDVQNNFTYYYAVSSFDVNTPSAGPPTLRSAQVAKETVPRKDVPNIVNATLNVTLSGDDGVALDASAPNPGINSSTGVFSGPFPPTNAVVIDFAPAVPRLLPAFGISARLDSIVPTASPGSSFGTPTAECATGGDPFSSCLKHYLSVDEDGTITPVVIDVYNPWWAAFGEGVPQEYFLVSKEIPFDSDALAAFDIPSGSGFATAFATYNEALNNSAAESAQNRRSGSSGTDSRVRHGGSRWFSGANETVADPAAYMRVGHLDGVDTVWAPISFTPLVPGGSYDNSTTGASFEKQCFNRAIAKMGRAADVQFTWSGGAVTVRDVVHHVDVPFSPSVRSSYGFLTTDANNNGFIDWQDFNYIDGAHQVIRRVGGGNCDAAGGGSWDPGGTATPVFLSETPSFVDVSTAGIDQVGIAGLAPTGRGFGLYINGERYIFEFPADELPADGTVWTLRTYSGSVRSNSATLNSEDPEGYSYNTDFTNNGTGTRPLIVSGLTLTWAVEEATNFGGTVDLKQIHTVPDPYLATSVLDLAPTFKQLQFVNLPEQATIRIYTLTGILVDQIEHDDPTGGGRAVWNLRNRNNQFVASGVYFFHVITPSGEEHVGKMTIVNYASQ